MTKLCFLLVIVYVVQNVHQFPSNDKELRRGSSSEQIFDETAFDLCQSILTQIISRLEQKGNIHKLLQQTGDRVNYWMFEKGISYPNHWCNFEIEENAVVHFSWNSKRNNCVNLEVFNDNGTYYTDYICGLNTNTSNNVQRGFDDLISQSGTISKSNSKTKRSLTGQFICSYVNLPKEIKSTECSKPTLNVYLNKQLIFSNASGVVNNDVPMDSIEIHINDDFSRFINKYPLTEKMYYISEDKVTYPQAKEICSEKGMTMVTAHNKAWTDNVMSVLPNRKNDRFWMLGNKLSGDWSWSDGERMDYYNWDKGEPNDSEGNDDCIEFITERNGTWNDITCDKLRYYICEKVPWTETTYRVPPTVNIFVGEKLAYQKLPADHQDESNDVEVKIGVDGDAVDDHSTKFLLLKKNSSHKEYSEQRLVTPKNFIDSDFNGIDIRIEDIKQKGFICEWDKFYEIYTAKKLTYIDAQKFCQNLSLQLLSIKNEMQHLHIERIMLTLNINHYYWTSGNLAVDGATWLWNENEAVTYFNWAKGEPNNFGGNEKCIEIFVPWKTAKWNDQDCQDKNRIICETYTEPYWRRVED